MGKETERIYTFTDKELERLVQISARESIKASEIMNDLGNKIKIC